MFLSLIHLPHNLLFFTFYYSMATHLNKFLKDLKLTSPSQQYMKFRSSILATSPTRNKGLLAALRVSKKEFVEPLLKVWHTTYDVRVINLLVTNAIRNSLFGSRTEFVSWLSRQDLLSEVFVAMRDFDDLQNFACEEMFQANPDCLEILMSSTDTSPAYRSGLETLDASIKADPPRITDSDFNKAFPQLIRCMKHQTHPWQQSHKLHEFFDHEVALNWAAENKDLVVLSLLYFRTSTNLIKIVLDKFELYGVMKTPQICAWIMGSPVMHDVFEKLLTTFDCFKLKDVSKDGLLLHPHFLLKSFPNATEDTQQKVKTIMRKIIKDKDARFVPFIKAICPKMLKRTDLSTFNNIDVLQNSEKYWGMKDILQTNAIQTAVYCITTPESLRTKFGLKKYIETIKTAPFEGMQWGETIAKYLGFSQNDIIEGPTRLASPSDVISWNRPTVPKKRNTVVVLLPASKRRKTSASASNRPNTSEDTAGPSKRPLQDVIDVPDSDDESGMVAVF